MNDKWSGPHLVPASGGRQIRGSPHGAQLTDAIRATLQAALGTAYRIERELGGGGMSRVFVARDLALDRDVVVKVLPPESTEGVSADRFRREIQLIARLQHPHVVSIISAGAAEGGVLYYVMPFVGGETVRARITREGPFAVADAARILREVLDALAFAHRLGVIHRDIKPENILLEAGHAVMADFGISKALRESGTMTSVGTAVGTPAYMAPEQATGDPTTDHRADLYSVGVLAFEMLTGAPPFTGSAQQLIVAHLTTPAPSVLERRSDVPPALADVIARAMAKEPKERPQSAHEMLAALDAAVTPVAITPTAAVTSAASAAAAATLGPTPPARTGARRGGLLLAAAVVAVAVIAANMLGWFGPRTPRSAVADGAELIAVMPLAAVSDSSLARLGQDLVVTLSANFDGVGNLRTVDAITLLMRARRLPQPIPLAEARTLAGELGARSVLTGTLISEGDLVRASVALQMVSGDSTLAKATALALPRDIAALTDSLTWEVLRQVWRRGAAPSPVLAGLTTRSFEALRIFLDGERHFQRLETEEALRSYRRALELDTNFVQAMLRYDYVRRWSLMDPDAAIAARLQAAKDRLPERERRWLEVTTAPASVPERIAATKALVAEYPEYPPALMSAADIVIHSGPLYGVAIEEAQPYLDRLDVLVPDHADTKFHQVMVALAHGSEEGIVKAFESMAAFSGSGWSEILAADAKVLRALFEGKPLPPVTSHDAPARAWAKQIATLPGGETFAGLSSMAAVPVDHRIAMIRHHRTDGVLTSQEAAAAAIGEGLTLASRGDWPEALRTMRPTEDREGSVGARLTTARTAALGAWVGALDPAAADSAVRRAVALVGATATATAADRLEARWSAGVMGVLTGDDARVRESLAALRADTSRVARFAARSLDVVRMDRAGIAGAADSALALSDEAMRTGGFMLSHQAVDRFIAARALRRRGEPARAERYLMWTDAAVNTARSGTTANVLLPLTAYERGVALDEAGDRAGAVYQLNRFISRYTRPPEAHRALVEDAKKRLARLEGAAR
jgi:hypothetical protein